MDKKEKIIKALKDALETCETKGAVSLILSVNYGSESLNSLYGELPNLVQSLVSQEGDIDNSTIPVIEKAITIAKIVY